MTVWSKEECIKTLEEAILAVAPEYFRVELPSGKHQHGERVFAYELYHQMRGRFPTKHGNIHGEYRKALAHVPHVKDNRTFVPDLVLHQSGSTDENLLAIEIKASRRPSVKEVIHDLEKLEFYTSPNGLNYKIGVMLILNSSVRTLLKQDDSAAKWIAASLSRGPRVAIWNIESPLGMRMTGAEHRSLDTLDRSCLQVFRADDVAKLAQT